MSLRRLSILQFRNIQSIDIELSSSVNSFFGPNGSGKTSILEAISLLSLGRSFRSRKTKTLINHQANGFTLFGEVIDDGGVSIPVGVLKNRVGDVIIKKSGSRCSSAAELAQILPLRVIDSHSFQFLEGGPSVRRQFLDWLVFHVEPNFIRLWRDYEICLKQRNMLVRHDKIDRLMLQTWETKLAACGSALTMMRETAFQRLNQSYLSRCATGPGELSAAELRFYAGWDTNKPLQELLLENRPRDVELGYTLQGPHRADLRLVVGKNRALDVLSRGQQKVIVCALYVAQGQVLADIPQRKTTYLVDDLPAELDCQSRQLVADWLVDINAQVFVTGIERRDLEGIWPQSGVSASRKMFHVKQGNISPASGGVDGV